MTIEPSQSHATAPPPGGPFAGWRRLVLIGVLLNLPLFFHGCGPRHQAKFTLGTLIPFAEVTSVDRPPPVAVNSWSWAWCAANFLATAGLLFAACRVGWSRRLLESTLALPTLLIVAALFNSFFYLPIVWMHAVFTPTWYLFAALHWPLGEPEGAHPTYGHYALLVASRLYYAFCVAGLGASLLAVRFFLRKYFFLPGGQWWQIQLGGLMVVVVVLGTAVGILVRLMMSDG